MASVNSGGWMRFAAMFLFLCFVFTGLILGARKLEEMFYLDGHKPRIATLFRLDGQPADGPVAGLPAEPGMKHVSLRDVPEGKIEALVPGDRVRLSLPGQRDVRGRITKATRVDDQHVLEGQLERGLAGSFFLKVRKGRLAGRVVPQEGGVAYQIASDDHGKTYLVERRKEAMVSAE